MSAVRLLFVGAIEWWADLRTRLIALNITNMAQLTTRTNGWAIVTSGKPQTNPVKLVHTADGGRTWTTIKVNYK